MKLDYLWIDGFKNLNDFAVDFDEKSPVTVIIGWNGTGKSNLLEALVIIFRDLDLGQETPFAYKLHYSSRGHRVKIVNDPGKSSRRERLHCIIESLDGRWKSGSGNDLRRFLPAYVFGYYSGPSRRLKEHFLDHQRRYYDQVIRDENATSSRVGELKALRRLFCAEDHHAKYALLAFFSQPNDRVTSFLRDYMRIEGLESVLFIMKCPPWAKNRKQRHQHLWGAKGLVRLFLEELFTLALAPMTLAQNLPTGIKTTNRENLLYLYLKDVAALQRLAEDYRCQSDFFAAMESADLSEVIHDVQIKVKIRNYDGNLTYPELSEGEQQLLMVLGLLRFAEQEESLILLDEPDTHLNPQWAIDFIQMLEQYSLGKEIGDPATSTTHLIFATHNPLAIAGLSEKQVQILTRDEETGRIRACTPDIAPIGLGVAGVLRVMFGLESSLDRQTEEKLRRRHELYGKEDRTSKEDVELRELSEELGGLGFMREFRDPTYGRFVRAMAKWKAFRAKPVSAEDMREQEELAQKAAEQIVAEEKP